MRKRSGLAAALALALAGAARADVLALSCQTARGAYAIRFDTETRLFTRQDGEKVQTYRIVRTQIDGPDALVWGATREHGGDVLAFFGAKAQVKYFFGNGSELTDSCKPG